MPCTHITQEWVLRLRSISSQGVNWGPGTLKNRTLFIQPRILIAGFHPTDSFIYKFSPWLMTLHTARILGKWCKRGDGSQVTGKLNSLPACGPLSVYLGPIQALANRRTWGSSSSFCWYWEKKDSWNPLSLKWNWDPGCNFQFRIWVRGREGGWLQLGMRFTERKAGISGTEIPWRAQCRALIQSMLGVGVGVVGE